MDSTTDALKILEQVNSFYDKSYTHLTEIIIAFLAFVGVVLMLAGVALPVGITWWQSKKFDRDRKSFDEKMKAEAERTKSIVRKELKRKINHPRGKPRGIWR